MWIRKDIKSLKEQELPQCRFSAITLSRNSILKDWKSAERSEKKNPAIQKLTLQCQKLNFKGINIDFEDMNLDSDENLIAFMKELSETFKQNKLLVTMDIMTDNDDYNIQKLNPYVDYFVLMAYDEYILQTAMQDLFLLKNG
jgi:hypothetical protein